MKNLIGFILSAVLLIAPLTASAQTYTDAQKATLIASLQQQILTLTKIIQQMISQQQAQQVAFSSIAATSTVTVAQKNADPEKYFTRVGTTTQGWIVYDGIGLFSVDPDTGCHFAVQFQKTTTGTYYPGRQEIYCPDIAE